MSINKIMVVGAGQMGAGIAQVAAQVGYSVVLNDIKKELVEKGWAGVDKNLTKLVSKEKISEDDKKGTLGRMATSVSLNDAADCDLVVEAVIEDMNIKSQVFGDLDKITPAKSIL